MSEDTRAMSDFTLDGLHKALMKERDFLYKENARLQEELKTAPYALDTITKLEKENARLREALELICMDNIYVGENGWRDEYFLCVKQAREALKGSEE